MKPVVVFGAGSFGEVADVLLREDGGREVLAFSATADAVERQPVCRGRPVVPIDELPERFDPAGTEVFVAVGYRRLNAIRREICGRIEAMGFSLLSYVHSTVARSSETVIGKNVFIFEDNTIQPFTTIGDGAVIWSGNHLGHHSTIEDWAFVTSHAVISGHCRIGVESFIGVNCTIADSVRIGPRNLIGPGALIQKDTGPDEVWLAERAERFPKRSSMFFK